MGQSEDEDQITRLFGTEGAERVTNQHLIE